MIIRRPLFWLGWGPNFENGRGWWLSLVWRPRPGESKVGERIKCAWRLDVDRRGPDLFAPLPKTSASRWTGLEYDWPPRFTFERGL